MYQNVILSRLPKTVEAMAPSVTEPILPYPFMQSNETIVLESLPKEENDFLKQIKNDDIRDFLKKNGIDYNIITSEDGKYFIIDKSLADILKDAGVDPKKIEFEKYDDLYITGHVNSDGTVTCSMIKGRESFEENREQNAVNVVSKEINIDSLEYVIACAREGRTMHHLMVNSLKNDVDNIVHSEKAADVHLKKLIGYLMDIKRGGIGGAIAGAIVAKSIAPPQKGKKSTLRRLSHDTIEKYGSKWDIEIGDAEWTTADIAYWKTFGQEEFLTEQKLGFVKKYNAVIKDAAEKFDIPEELLAGVVYNEYGGDPLWIDDVAYSIRDYDWSGSDTHDKWTVTKRPELTSFGNVSLQVRRVAEMYGYDPCNLTKEQAEEIIDDLKNPEKSIYLAAAHLSDLRDIDYAGVSREDMDDNTIRDVATRYNRGPDISLDEVHQNTSYGDSIIKHEEEIMDALEE